MSEQRKIDWTNLDIDEDWFDIRSNALTPELILELARHRGLPPTRILPAVNGGIGWDADTKSWVLPLRNIHGTIHMAKLWRPSGGKWIHAGRGSAMRRQKDGPVGRIFDLGWVTHRVFEDESWNTSMGGGYLWVTAGEWDCVMLRCFGWLATTSVLGETSKPQTSMLLREFGGEEGAAALFERLKGIAVCFDVDGAGHVGAVQFVDAFTKLIDSIGVQLPVKPIDLRELPGWDQSGKPSGWDISDLIRWSRKTKVKIGDALRSLAINGGSGVDVAREMFDIDDSVSSAVNVDDVVRPAMHMIELDDIIAFGISYATNKTQSRGQGAYHAGLIARKKGWLFKEFVAVEGHLKFVAACVATFGENGPNGTGPFTIDEAYLHFSRGFANASSAQNDLMNDTANAHRFAHTFSFLKYVPETKAWRYWDGVRWSNGDAQAVDHAMRLPDYIDEEAAQMYSDNETLAKSLYKWARRSRSMASVFNTLRGARESTLCRLTSELGEQWDNNTLHVGTPRGVFDLMSGELLVGIAARDMYCSMSTRGNIMRDNAEGVARWGDMWENGRKFWSSLLEQWQVKAPDSANVITMLQQMGGMCLRGQLDERLFILKGSGRSGKSTMLDGIQEALGEYAYEAAGDVFVKDRKSAGGSMRPAVMAQMNYKRMIKVTEVGGKQLDVDVLKQMTGESLFTGKLLYVNPGVSVNHGTYFMMTNHDIDLRGDQSEALRGRLLIVPFETSFIDISRMGEDSYSSGIADGSVREQLDIIKSRVRGRAGWEVMHDVILTWMYEGFCGLRDNGWRLAVAESIHHTTTDMWETTDVLGLYWTESGYWERAAAGEAGTIVRSAWLANSVYSWAEVWSPDLLDKIGGDNATEREKTQALGNLLRTAGARGYEKTKKKQCLGSRGVQENCWRVPWNYVGPDVRA